MTRKTVRRLRALAAAAVLAAPALPPAFAADPAVRLRLVQEAPKEYAVEGSFTVPSSSCAVWGVLTDYDNISDFVPSMRHSRVVGRAADGALLVDQEAVGGAFFLHRAVRVRLEVRQTPAELSFRDVSGRDFRLYAGDWTARETPLGTVVTYRLHAEPDFVAPGFFVRRGLTRGARDLLGRVRDEILRRTPRYAAVRQ